MRNPDSKNTSKSRFKLKAFSLLKLSFVIIILAVSIALSKNLVGKSRITNAQTLAQSSPVMALTISELETVNYSFFANLFISEANAAGGSELSDVMKYMSKKFNIKIPPAGTTCNGIITDGGCDVTSCIVTTPNVTQSVVSKGSGALTCNAGYSGSPTYNCTSGTFTPTGSCSPITCNTVAGTGYNAKSNLAYPSGSFSCDVTGYTGTKTYACNAPGAATGITGTCNAITCPVSVTGISSPSSVSYTPSSTSMTCNVAGYAGSVNYTCTTGSLNVTGSCVTLPAQCTSYISRSFDDTYVGLGVGSVCHKTLSAGWYRLTGSYPKLQQQGSYLINIGNNNAPGFMQFDHPSTIGQTVTGNVGFNWNNKNLYWKTSIQVTNCSSYFVYYLLPTTVCNIAYVSGF